MNNYKTPNTMLKVINFFKSQAQELKGTVLATHETLSKYGTNRRSTDGQSQRVCTLIWRYAAALALFLILSTGNVWGDINWNDYSWIDKNQCDASCLNKYKINSTSNPSPNNIQYRNSKLGIHMSFTSAITSCSLGSGEYEYDGAALWIFLTTLTAQETAVSVTCVNGGPYNFVVYYADGEMPGIQRTYDGEEKMYFLRDAWDWWKNDGAKFYAYFWNTSTNAHAWSEAASWAVQTTSENKDVWAYTVPEGTWDKVIITRHPSSTTTPTFDNASNKSNDITLEATTNLLTDWTVSGQTGHAITWKNITLASKTVYFDNRNVTDWTTAYVRIGHNSSNSAWGPMTKVAGTRNLYSQTTSQWDFHTDFTIANAQGWTGSNNIYQPWENQNWASGASGLQMTKQTNYQKYGIDRDAYLCPASTSVLERSCQYYKVNSSTSTSTIDSDNQRMALPQYTVTATGTNCSVELVEYTNDALTTSQAITNNKVDPTRYVGVTVTPSTGYQFGSVSLTSSAYETHTAAAANVTGKYAIMADCEISATCTPITYNIVYKDQGDVAFTGTHETGYPTTHTYATATILKTASKVGYTFGGWFANSACTGAAVATLGATDYTADITLYAKWTINSHTLTWDFNGGNSSETAGTNYTAGGSVTYGTSITYPSNGSMSKTGHTFSSWSTVPPTTMPDNDLTITANWTPINYNVTYSAPSNGIYTISVAGGAASSETKTANYNQTISLVATPNSGYSFSSWTITKNGGGTVTPASNTASTTFTMPADGVTVTATFAKIPVNAGPSGLDNCQIFAVHTSGDEYSPIGMTLANWEYCAASGAAFTDDSSKKAYKVSTNSSHYAGLYFGSTWTGVPTTLCDASSATKLHIEFYSPTTETFNFDVISYYNSANHDGTVQSVTATAGVWQVIDFDLSVFGGEITGHKDVLSGFKIDYGSGNTYKELYIANVYFYKADAPCTVHANRTDLLDCQMKAIFGVYSYTNAGVTTIEWDESLNVVDHTQSIDGKNVLHITFSAAHKTMLKFTELNLTSGNFTHVHFDVWSPVSRDLASSILCYNDGYKRENVSHVESLTAMQWKSVDFALSSLDGMSAYYDKAQALIINMGVGATSLTSDLYITNFYFYNEDNTKPVITSATNSGVSGTDLTLTLTATYKGNSINTFRITNTTTSQVYDRTADGSNHVTIPDINYCESYDLEIQAIYNGCILSDATEMTVNGNSLPTNTALISTTSSVTADANALQATDAIDNNTATRWASGSSATDVPHYIQVDLGSLHNVASMIIGWEYSNPSDYYIEGSVDGTNYYPLKHETTVPPHGSAEGAAFNDYDTYTFADAVGIQYLKVRSVTNKSGYGMSIWEMQAYGQCYSASDYPVTTYAQVASQVANGTNTAVNVTLDLGAYDYTTTFDNMRWKITYTPEGGVATNLDNQTASSGQITLNGLEFSTTYSVTVQARDGVNGNLGNAINFSFTTLNNQPTLYFRSALNWQDGGLNTDYRFAYVSPGSAIMTYTTPTLVTNELQYRPYNDANNNLAIDDAELPGGGFSTAFNQFINGQNGNAITFYAKDKEHFVSNADLVYLIGTAVNATESTALQMSQSGTTYYWEGPVQSSGGNYRVIVKAQETNNIAAASFTEHSKARIMDLTNWANSSNWTYARLTFDMTTWTCTWEEYDPTECSQNGGVGSGETYAGGTVFTSGYTYSIKKGSAGKIIVSAATTDEGTAGRIRLIFHRNATDASEYAIVELANNVKSVTNQEVTLPVAVANDEYAYISIKFEIGTEIRFTEQILFNLKDGGCVDPAEAYFDIYHHDDAPVGARTSFAGGNVVLPIRYFRHFEHTDWCTITLPFEVSKVTVYDESDQQEYDLYPRFNNGSSDVEGYYWLKTFSGQVTLSNFKPSWQPLTVGTPGSTDAERAANVKPAKNTPYVIAFPDGTYYGSNWVIFHGAAFQTIASEFTGGSSIALTDGYDYSLVQLQGNNTMHESGTLNNIYMIEEGFDYFTRRTSATVPAFEAYVIGTAQVQKKYSVLRYNAESTPDTPTETEGLPTTECRGEVYSLSGILIGSYDDRDEMEQMLNSLTSGIYIVRNGTQVTKIAVR